MSDENVQPEVPVEETKPVVVEGKPLDTVEEKKEAVPAYHTQESWAAAKERTEAVKPVDPKDFAYSYNGYDVKAVEATGGTRGDENGLVYEITQGDFKTTVVEKQDAVTWVQTHSSDYAKNA